MNRTQDIAGAFVLGAAIGGIAALLFAPEKGEVTRKRLKDGAVRLAKRGQTFVGNMRGATAAAMKTAVHTARTQAEAVKGAVAEGARTYREQLNHTRA